MKLSRTLAILIFSTVFWALVFETGARVYVGRGGDPLDRARLVLEPSARYLWRVRPNFDGAFENAKLTTERHGFRVFNKNADWLMLGPSSAFGWGVDEADTYFAIGASENKIVHSNLAQIGYGISQGRRLFDDFRAEWKSKPRTIFFAHGVNDLDRFRFFGPSGSDDATAFTDPKLQERLDVEYWIYRAAFPALLMRRLQEAAFKFGCPPPTAFATRTTIPEFLGSLASLITDSENDGHTAIVLNSPLHYPFEIEPTRALEADLEFEASAAAARDGRCPEARDHFAKARLAEPHRVASAIQNLNAALGAEASKRGWTLVDIAMPLTASSDFVDPIHFSKAGHIKVADAIRKRMHSKEGLAP